ncbi:MAG: hypothetical protein JSS89_09695 [Bacteroidetes bacterium]|nr:hypothetical protein [Bacteroidota bacterium]
MQVTKVNYCATRTLLIALLASLTLVMFSMTLSAQAFPEPYKAERILHGAATVGTHAVAWSVPIDAYVLSSHSGDIAPFYHASGLLFTVPTVTIDSVVSVRLRTAAECWNFSASYQSPTNVVVWAKPSILIQSPLTSGIDSVRLLAGDLWRVRVGQGLALDYFEALGASVRLVTGKVGVEATTIGYGWTGSDDIYTMSVQYDSTVRFNGFMNFGGSFPNALASGTGHYLLSVDVQKQFNELLLYTEAGVGQGGVALLGGATYTFRTPTTFCALHAEGRIYPSGFFPAPVNDSGYTSNRYPYFNSVTALDKPVMTYRNFAKRLQGLYLRLTFRQSIAGPLIVGTDTEYFRNLYTDTYIGLAFGEGAEISVGYMNKTFELYDPTTFAPMFTNEPMILLRCRTRL